MECSTVYCECDDYCTCLSSTRPKARKEHKCNECKRIIPIGDKYLREVTLYDGEVEAWKTCKDCESIRDNFFTGGYYYGEILYTLREHIYESYGDVSESCIADLTPGAQEIVCNIIEDYWGDNDDEDEDD